MAVKAPGFDNSVGNRNRRTNRYGNSGANNRAMRRHKLADDITLAFAAPDQITDSNNDLGQFEVEEFIDVQGSVAQDAEYEVATVVVGQLDMVEQTITLEAAGPSIAVNSRNNRVDSRLT